MSARNGQRARFHRNRKRRVVQRMRVKALLAPKEQPAAAAPAADAAPPARQKRGGPALTGRN